jgi:hypothetical protein
MVLPSERKVDYFPRTYKNQVVESLGLIAIGLSSDGPEMFAIIGFNEHIVTCITR